METHHTELRRRPLAGQRTGFVLVAVVVVFTIGLALFGVWAQAAVAQHRQLRNEQLRLQAVRLAEAGVGRALARRVADPQYVEETWSVPANVLDGNRAAEVRIRIEPAPDASAWRVEATAEFPAGALRRAKITKQVYIPKSTFGD